MKRTPAASEQATQAELLVSGLQQRFVQGLESLASAQKVEQRFKPVEWFRDDGRHGGGVRFEAASGPLFGRGSVNVSQVHYDDMPEKKLGSATAISTIIHPRHPLAPSVHIHVSWTGMKQGGGYWRMMADLNPSIPDDAATARFFAALKAAAPEQFDEAKAQGERYFHIPALGRHRGVAHFYLENYHTADAAADIQLARAVGEAAIDTYLAILGAALAGAPPASREQRATQLDYHTLYFFQVLTLDRGTTTGLLVHDQNDVGIMGSLPACVDRDLLASWVERMDPPQDELLEALIAALPDGNPCLVDEHVKARLATVVRRHYLHHPEAIAMQASGDVIPSTVQNHTD
ncbi:MAG TPA: coproporphyrinogen III oxidase [Mariprofundaceae bacterium]|nr:coproporphyrinogen III oxidase [Mariprofundaceae bacterium]